jgi:hypothetical protein
MRRSVSVGCTQHSKCKPQQSGSMRNSERNLGEMARREREKERAANHPFTCGLGRYARLSPPASCFLRRRRSFSDCTYSPFLCLSSSRAPLAFLLMLALSGCMCRRLRAALLLLRLLLCCGLRVLCAGGFPFLLLLLFFVLRK